MTSRVFSTGKPEIILRFVSMIPRLRKGKQTRGAWGRLFSTKAWPGLVSGNRLHGCVFTALVCADLGKEQSVPPMLGSEVGSSLARFGRCFDRPDVSI